MPRGPIQRRVCRPIIDWLDTKQRDFQSFLRLCALMGSHNEVVLFSDKSEVPANGTDNAVSRDDPVLVDADQSSNKAVVAERVGTT